VRDALAHLRQGERRPGARLDQIDDARIGHRAAVEIDPHGRDRAARVGGARRLLCRRGTREEQQAESRRDPGDARHQKMCLTRTSMA
jgi:hypothetical protein